MLKDSLRKLLILSLVCLSTPYGALLAEAPSKRDSSQSACDDPCQSSRISARHIENKGIGYNTGYTTLEAFLAAPTDWSVMPFVDLRGHIFNDGHWAANSGLGLRSLLEDRIYGAYAYYDYRNTEHKNGYNQVSFGVETLGAFWDLRLNGYVAVGNRQSRGYDAQFSHFAGNSIYYTQKFEQALSGGNGEVGFYPLKMRDVTLYTGIGPYYLKGSSGGAVWGGQTRAKAMWRDYVGAEVSYSYDHVFKNIVQGQVFLSYSFGPKREVRENSKESPKKNKELSCMDNYLLCQRMIEPVGKSEIIPVSTKKSKSLAINPATGQPYTILFVNNLSHSAGTYESPFSTLAAAESASQTNDVIYVYPGDLTSTGLSNGITLKDGQQLLGAAIDQNLMTTAGPIVLSAQASGPNAPLLINGAGAVVTLASDNVVSGFYIQNTAGAGILASGSNNATLTQNYIQGTSSSHNGIQLDNVTGKVTASSNTIMDQGSCVNIDNSSPVSNAAYLFTGNTLQSEDGSYGFNIAYTEGSNNYFLSLNNNLYASATAGINISCSNTTANTPYVFDITNCNIGTGDNYAFTLALSNESVAELIIQNSTMNSYYGLEISCADSSSLALNIGNNTISNYEYAISIGLADSSDISGTLSDNTVNSLYYGISVTTSDSSNFTANINNNVINSAYYHIETTNSNLSTYSGTLIGNTFIGQDGDDTVYWSAGTSGTVSSTIANNLFTGNASGITLVNSGAGAASFEMLNNTIQNSTTAGIGIVNSGANLVTAISGNTFQGFSINALSVSNTAGEMCLQFNNNTSNLYPNAYVIGATGGTLNLVAPTGNLGHLQTTGTTSVSACP